MSPSTRDNIYTDTVDVSTLNQFVFFEIKSGFAMRFENLRRALEASLMLQVPLFAYWPLTGPCNGHYLNYFESIDNVTFVDKSTARGLRNHPGRLEMPAESRRGALRKHLPVLRPRAEYIKRIEDFVDENEIGQAIGFHVRKTDLKKKARRQKFIPQYQVFHKIAESTSSRIFLATDDGKVRNEFVRKYGSKIVFYECDFDVGIFSGLRQTTLEAAIIELYILSHCMSFYGTEDEEGKIKSSFSRLAKDLHGLKRENSL